MVIFTCTGFTACVGVTTPTVFVLREIPGTTEEKLDLSSCVSWGIDAEVTTEDDDLGTGSSGELMAGIWGEKCTRENEEGWLVRDGREQVGLD